jgi:hypothetical protein
MSSIHLSPRLIRLKDAPEYLGMDRHRFNADVRTKLIEIPIGLQGIAFDRLDLDAWVDDYKQRSGRPAANKQGGMGKWDENEHQESTKKVVTGKLTKRFMDSDFAKALELATSKKQRNI